MPQPAGPPQSFARSGSPLAYRHHQELHFHGVDLQVHSQAIAAALSAQAQAQPAQLYVQDAVNSVQHDANEQAQEYANRVRSEVRSRPSCVAGNEAQQHLEIANQAISSLQARNRELEDQHQQLRQQMDILQANMQQMMARQQLQADTSGTHAASIAQAYQAPNQNGSDVSEALKALAASVGETMNELRTLVSPKALGRKVPQRNPFQRLRPKGLPKLESMMLCLLQCLVP